jgi:uncharacterized membrane protein YeaQ/YmgE (transglycosylase-associated protein family)
LNNKLLYFLAIPFLCSLLYGCVGPPVGSLGVSIPLVLSSIFSNDPWSTISDPSGTIGWSALFSFIFGIVPAVVTGFLLGLVIRYLNAPFFILLSGVSGAVISFFFNAIGRRPYPYNPFAYINFWAAMETAVVPGVIGGIVCGAIASLVYKRLTTQSRLPPWENKL